MFRTLLCIVTVAALSLVPLNGRLAAEPSQATQHRVVFEMVSDQPSAWQSLLNNVENLQKSLAPATILVVVHGPGLAMLTTAKNADVRARLSEDARAGVVFAACENTMKRKNVSKDALVSFAKTVDSGVAEVVRKQEAGWSYVRSGS